MKISSHPDQKKATPSSHDRIVAVGIIIAGLASVAGLATMIYVAIGKVGSGHGLDTYRTVWLVEFNWIGFLVFLAATFVVLVAVVVHKVATFLNDRNEMRKLEARYPIK